MAKADIRISNAERDEAVTALGEHLSTGRLNMSEYEDRCGLAAAATTRGHLEALFTDLPAPHPDLSSATPPGQLIRKAGQLVTSPGPRGHHQRAIEKQRQTPASSALEVIGGLCMILGIPGAILLVVFTGIWWPFIPIGAIMIIAGAASEAAKKPRPKT